MIPQHHLPADIERTSMGIITAELAVRGLTVPPENAAVVKRVIHTTADFDYAENLRFTPGAAAAGVAAMRAGAVVITDTNMALAGITKPGLAKLGGQALCFMADPAVAAAAKAAGSTRAAAAMHRAAREYPGAVLAVGNARSTACPPSPPWAARAAATWLPPSATRWCIPPPRCSTLRQEDGSNTLSTAWCFPTTENFGAEEAFCLLRFFVSL